MPLPEVCTMRSENFLASLRHAIAGIVASWRTQRNLRIQLAAAVAVVVAACACRITRIEWAILLMTIGSVIAAEMLNTAIEAIVDLASPEYHPLAKQAKDASAGCVLVLAITSIGVGLAILGPPLWALLMRIA